MYGDTPLHSAAFRRHEDVVELLIALGADIHYENSDGSTPLDFAANQSLKETMQLLFSSRRQGRVLVTPCTSGIWSQCRVDAVHDATVCEAA
eukprot:m.187695 g.187695  ORF g.187695 m.187695 type:complete len:92 (+) comp10549_c0_seq8:290-565(+)